MKIILQEEDWVSGEATGAADVIGLRDKIFADIPFNLTNVQHKAINTEWEYIMIPYYDKELQRAVAGLAYEIAESNRWQYPDEENIKTSVMINMDGKDCDTFKATLYVEVQPPIYSEQEKVDILAGADQDVYDMDFSEYTMWVNIFESAEAFHNGTDGGMSETVGTYDIELEPDEQNTLQWLTIQHLHMVACGGRYAS